MNELCRTCLSQSNELISIYVIASLDGQIKKMISLCIGLELSKLDNFSNNICIVCFNKLLDAYKFRLMCWKSNEYLIKKSFEKLQPVLHDSEIIDLTEDEKPPAELHENELVDHIEEDLPKPEKVPEKLKCLNSLKPSHCEEKPPAELHESELVDHTQEDLPAPKKVPEKLICLNRLKRSHCNYKIKDQNYHRITRRQCYLCSERFFTLPTLKEHFRSCHKAIYNEELVPAEEKTCKICNQLFKTVYGLRKHITNLTFLEKQRSFPNSLLNQNLQKRKLISRKNETKSGIRIKTRKCYLCTETFVQLPQLIKHLYIVHKIEYNEEDIPVQAKTCKICKKQVPFKALIYHLKTHRRYPRTPEICEYCGLKYKTRQNLAIHMRKHTGEKIFKCDKCDFSTVHPSSGKRHKLTHTNERHVECPTCSKMFLTTSDMRKHQDTHMVKLERPFLCFVCQKSFSNKKNHKEHMKIHDYSKQLSCSYCDKKFAKRWGLHIHLKQHTGEKPYSCKVCCKGFIQRHSLKTHMENHHKNIDIADA